MSRLSIAAAALVLPFFLGACASDTDDIPCPYLRVLTAGENFARHLEGAPPSPETLELEAQIIGLDTMDCDYDEEDDVLTSATMDLSILFAARRGPASPGAEPVERVPYFVSLIAPDQSIVAKQSFVAELEFPQGVEAVAQDDPEEITLEIPLGGDVAGWQYQVIVGFQLTPEQLERQQGMKE